MGVSTGRVRGECCNLSLVISVEDDGGEMEGRGEREV